MGCCASEMNANTSILINKKIKGAIKKNNIKSILKIKNNPSALEIKNSLIDKEFTVVDGLNLNPLGYALYIGKYKSFTQLYNYGASLKVLDDLLRSQGKSTIDIICEKGYGDFLSFYLPIYESSPQKNYSVISETNITVDFDRPLYSQSALKRTSTPIQRATEKGHIHIINDVYSYFKDKDAVCYLLDINYPDETTGENCPIIACRKGNFPLVKYFHEVCKADFRQNNRRNENVLVITAASSRKLFKTEYYDIFVYLVEVVKIPFDHNYEDILLLLEDSSIINFFQKKLKSSGIHVKKKEIEKKYEIDFIKANSGEKTKEIEKTTREKDVNEFIESRSIVSTIRSDENRSMTPFISIIIPEKK